MTRRSLSTPLTLTLLATLCAVLSCSSDSAPPAPPASSYGQLYSPYTFKFYASNGTNQKLVQVVPREIANAARKRGAGTPAVGSATSGVASPGVQALNLSLQDVPPTKGSTTEPIIITGPETLILGAAAECGMVDDPNNLISAAGSQYQNDPTFATIIQQENNLQTITGMPAQDMWSATGVALNYSIFPVPNPNNCDQLLEMEETLLCVADQLAQLADTVAPLTWTAVQWLPGNVTQGGTPPPLAWIVP